MLLIVLVGELATLDDGVEYLLDSGEEMNTIVAAGIWICSLKS